MLAIDDFSLHFTTRRGPLRVLDGISLEVAAGETVGLVGESGSGKSVLAFALLGLLPGNARITSGRLLLVERDLLRLGAGERRRTCGRDIAMVFQNYRAALNPIRTVGDQLADVLCRHTGIGRRAAWTRAIELLAQVRIPDPERRARAYPFELSGGQCQRVMIALALSCRPRLLLADEPVTGLDVTTQALVMDLILELARDHGTAVLLITHDLALAAERCARIAVMHAGHVVEVAPSAALAASPAHPYTAKLLAATPAGAHDIASMPVMAGNLPDLVGTVPPCRFSGRCERRTAACEEPALRLRARGERHHVACRHPLLTAEAAPSEVA